MKNMFWLPLFSLVLTTLMFTSISGCLGPTPPPMPKPDLNLTPAHNDFAFNMTHQLLKRDAGRNIFISPTSISMALDMAYDGSNGTTRSEMTQALGYYGLDAAQVNAANRWVLYSLLSGDKSVRLDIANSLWLNKDFQPRADYVKTMEDSYQAKVQSLDFEQTGSSDTINNWVSQKTNGKISKIIDQYSLSQSRAILINAIYFKADWSVPFKKSLTQSREFHLQNGTVIMTPLMMQKMKYDYTEDDQMQAVRLPYGNKSIAMYVFLPKQNSSFSRIDSFVQHMDRKELDMQIGKMKSMEGTVILPKFKIEYEAELINPLREMGIKQAFSSDTANFSAISQEPLYISKVLHKTYVLVDEQGTEAAAVTSIGMAMGAVAPPLEDFRMQIDRPFFFAIQDERSGEILFMGIIENPAG